MNKRQIARLGYYVCTHPMQYGSQASYRDWISSIIEILESVDIAERPVRKQAIEIAASFPECRLHEN